MPVRNTDIKSALFNGFDPLHPQKIDGYFSDVLFADPVEISAPLELVWSVMTDFAAYPSWNPLNRFFQLDTVAKPGERVTFGVSWGPYTKDDRLVPMDELKTALTQHERLTVWEPNRCLAYADDFGQWHRAERVQFISKLPNGNTRYHTYERWAGLITPLIRLAYNDKTQTGFNACSAALKVRAETSFNAREISGKR